MTQELQQCYQQYGKLVHDAFNDQHRIGPDV